MRFFRDERHLSFNPKLLMRVSNNFYNTLAMCMTRTHSTRLVILTKGFSFKLRLLLSYFVVRYFDMFALLVQTQNHTVHGPVNIYVRTNYFVIILYDTMREQKSFFSTVFARAFSFVPIFSSDTWLHVQLIMLR